MPPRRFLLTFAGVGVLGVLMAVLTWSEDSTAGSVILAVSIVVPVVAIVLAARQERSRRPRS
jgi:hypothetical protein